MPGHAVKVLRRTELEQKLGISRSAIYQYMKKGIFPKPLNLGARSVGWLESEIDAWLVSKMEARSKK